MAEARGEPQARDDAKHAALFSLSALPGALAFDHATILEDYRQFRLTGRLAPLREHG